MLVAPCAELVVVGVLLLAAAIDIKIYNKKYIKVILKDDDTLW